MALIRRFISNRVDYISVAKRCLSVPDIAWVLDRVICTDPGTGYVGGKAAGMLLAAAILRGSGQEAVRVPENSLRDASNVVTHGFLSDLDRGQPRVDAVEPLVLVFEHRGREGEVAIDEFLQFFELSVDTVELSLHAVETSVYTFKPSVHVFKPRGRVGSQLGVL